MKIPRLDGIKESSFWARQRGPGHEMREVGKILVGGGVFDMYLAERDLTISTPVALMPPDLWGRQQAYNTRIVLRSCLASW